VSLRHSAHAASLPRDERDSCADNVAFARFAIIKAAARACGILQEHLRHTHVFGLGRQHFTSRCAAIPASAHYITTRCLPCYSACLPRSPASQAVRLFCRKRAPLLPPRLLSRRLPPSRIASRRLAAAHLLPAGTALVTRTRTHLLRAPALCGLSCHVEPSKQWLLFMGIYYITHSLRAPLHRHHHLSPSALALTRLPPASRSYHCKMAAVTPHSMFCAPAPISCPAAKLIAGRQENDVALRTRGATPRACALYSPAHSRSCLTIRVPAPHAHLPYATSRGRKTSPASCRLCIYHPPAPYPASSLRALRLALSAKAVWRAGESWRRRLRTSAWAPVRLCARMFMAAARRHLTLLSCTARPQSRSSTPRAPHVCASTLFSSTQRISSRCARYRTRAYLLP